MINQIKRMLLKAIYKSQYRNTHYYSPIPNLKEIKTREVEIFKSNAEIAGVDLNINFQLDILKKIEQIKGDFNFNIESGGNNFYYSNNGFFNLSDAFTLASLMLINKPQKIVEVGSGFSSALMIDINETFFNNRIDLTFIEPYPQRLELLVSDLSSRGRLVKSFVQDVDLEQFKSLQANDILFIDSSHVSKVGSDVNHILFNVLPILNPGVLIHFHDITYPFEYPKDWIYSGIFWNEAYILKSFLMYNDRFKIYLFNSYLHHYHRDWCDRNIPGYHSEGGSIWLIKE